MPIAGPRFRKASVQSQRSARPPRNFTERRLGFRDLGGEGLQALGFRVMWCSTVGCNCFGGGLLFP